MYPKEMERQVVSTFQQPIVRTEKGAIRGLYTDGTYIFRGVPYAKAERFCLPEGLDAWPGVFDARGYGPACAEISTVIPADSFLAPHMVYPQSERCQNMNIWTQTIDPEARRPVMVWIHGGGFQHGSSVEIFSYDGEELSRFGNTVVVSLNHRLHALGFMDLSGYGEEYKYSAQCGMADIIAALEWVQKNIACFGGDPGNVTLFGQSGGAGKIQTLLQMPAADGLYHKISLQSGVRTAADITPMSAGERAEYVVRALGLTRKRSIKSIRCRFTSWPWAL